MDGVKTNRANVKVFRRDSPFDGNLLIPAGIFVGLGLLGLFLWWFFGSEGQQVNSNLYLLPWITLTAATISVPFIYTIYRGEFQLFQPLIFAGWGYFIPAFVVGGLIYASGVSQPYYLYYIKNPEWDIPLTFIYVSLGYAGLTIGYYLPFGRWIGQWVKQRTPVWDWQPNELLMPSLLLLLIGSISTVAGFILGVLGHQKNDEIGVFDGLLYLFSLFLLEAIFLLWFAIFRTKQLYFAHYAVMGIIVFLILARAAVAGNRGSLAGSVLLIFSAFILSGKKISLKVAVTGGTILAVAVLVGMIWGTTFRSLKVTQEKVAFTEYLEYIPRTVDAIGQQDTLDVLQKGFLSLAERVEGVGSTAVVVSNYEDLKPYEESYGLDNNIWKDLVTSFVPRFMWKEKPVASDPAKYGDLYFNYSENSFTITPMGDLLRNFGTLGVLFGMMLLGFILRSIYASLIEGEHIAAWRAALYVVILFTAVNYEGFFGIIIPYVIRIGAIATLGIIILALLMPNRNKRLSIT